jgi:beta-N-acetylhexosaminidase
VKNIKITPKIIVIHWTAIDNFEDSYKRFIKPKLPSDRPDIQAASALNVSAHFMVKRDGTIYRLMDETTMARHIIGLNYTAIGIENVGGQNNKANLTPAQLKANIALIQYLKEKYKTIDYLIGHYEYTHFIEHPLWLEKDPNYRTVKYDPSPVFMQALRQRFPHLKVAP